MRKIPAPTRPRQLFDLLHLYRPEAGLPSLLDRFDWNGVTRAQVHGAVLGRLPENRDAAMQGANYAPKPHFANTIASPAFQQNLIRNFLNAYPEKTRYLFVHIPKCAGTDFEVDMDAAFPSLAQSWQDRNARPTPELLAALARLSSDVTASPNLLVFGHFKLRWYLEQNLYRFGDRMFAITREPTAIILSLVNYILTVLVNDPGKTRLDTIGFLAALGLPSVPPDMEKPEQLALARMILHKPELVQPNYMCDYLGFGTALSTLDPLAITDMEIVDISRYTEWRQQCLGLGEGKRQNPSTRFLTESDLGRADRDYLAQITEEDRTFYSWIKRLLAKTDALSFRGQQIVREATG